MAIEQQSLVSSGVLRRLKVLSEDIINGSPNTIALEEDSNREDVNDRSDGIAQVAMESPRQQHDDRIADAERERALNIIAQDLKPSLDKGDAPADGNCLFDSIASQTVGKGQHAIVRSSIVEEVKENHLRYLEFVDDLDEWVKQMEKNSAWGDGIAIRASSNVYMAPVFVWRSQNPLQAPSVFLPENPEADHSPPILLELDEPCDGAEHYSPLRRSEPHNERADQAQLKEDGAETCLPSALEDKFKEVSSVPLCEEEEDAPSAKDSSNIDNKAPNEPSIMDTSDKLVSALSNTDKRKASQHTPLPKKKTKLSDDGCFAVGQISSPIKPSASCVKCAHPLADTKYRAVGKQKSVFICNVCNSRGTQLTNLYGKWPGVRFKNLNAEQIQEFWTNIKSIRNSKDLKLFVDDRLQISKSDQTGSKDNIETLPLSVWKARGFDDNVIREKCTPTEHPILGACYAVTLNSKWDQQCEEHKRSQDIRVGNHPSPPVAAKTPKMNSKEEIIEARQQARDARNDAKEKIRVSKAIATQEARKSKQKAVAAKKFLPRIVKAQFSVSSMLKGKFAKVLSDADHTEGQRIKIELVAMEKKLRAAMYCNGGDDVDGDACEELCSSAWSWSERSMAIISTASMTL